MDGRQQRQQKQSFFIVDLSEYSCTWHCDYFFFSILLKGCIPPFFHPRINIPNFMVDGELIKIMALAVWEARAPIRCPFSLADFCVVYSTFIHLFPPGVILACMKLEFMNIFLEPNLGLLLPFTNTNRRMTSVYWCDVICYVPAAWRRRERGGLRKDLCVREGFSGVMEWRTLLFMHWNWTMKGLCK